MICIRTNIFRLNVPRIRAIELRALARYRSIHLCHLNRFNQQNLSGNGCSLFQRHSVGVSVPDIHHGGWDGNQSGHSRHGGAVRHQLEPSGETTAGPGLELSFFFFKNYYYLLIFFFFFGGGERLKSMSHFVCTIK